MGISIRKEDANRIESIILEELRLLLQEINNSNDKTVIFCDQ